LVSSATELSGLQLVELFCARFRQEDGFRDLKQRLDWEECRAWTRDSIERTTQAQWVTMSLLRLQSSQVTITRSDSIFEQIQGKACESGRVRISTSPGSRPPLASIQLDDLRAHEGIGNRRVPSNEGLRKRGHGLADQLGEPVWRRSREDTDDHDFFRLVFCQGLSLC
jgi:hypothetical protein